MKDRKLGIYEKAISNHLSWKEKFVLAEQSGFECLELSIDATPERMGRLYDAGFAASLRKALSDTGIRICTMALTANRGYPLGSEDREVRQKGKELVRKAIELAEDTEIPVIHIAGYDELGDRCNQETKKIFYDSVAEVTAYAERFFPRLAIETMDAEFMGSCTNIRRLCEEIGSEKLRIYADIGNLTGMGKDVSGELKTGGSYIVGIHLKDALPGVMRDVVFGKGIVDFEEAFRCLEEIGYDGCMIAETWSYDKESFHPYLKQISAFLRARMSS